MTNEYVLLCSFHAQSNLLNRNTRHWHTQRSVRCAHVSPTRRCFSCAWRTLLHSGSGTCHARDENIHNLEMRRLALLAILGFELDSGVIDTKTVLDDLFEGVEQGMVVMRVIDHDVGSEGEEPRG